MKVPAFHTTSEEHSVGRRNVYHDNDRCGPGQAIKPEDRALGSGGLPRCDRCSDLAAAGQ